MVRALFVVAAVLAASALQSATVPFTTVTVDAAPPSSPWYKMVGDINGDGKPDIIVAGSGGPLVWYAAPTWTKTQIAANGWNGVKGDAEDVDGDGDVDIVMGGVVWFRNPRIGGGAWTKIQIDNQKAHDVEVGDLDRDGKMDVVGRDQSAFGSAGNAIYVYRQTSPTAWTKRTFTCPHGEGLKLADMDRDGDPDIVIGGRWYENSGDPIGGAWTERVYTTAYTEGDAKVEVADVNGDGRVDVVLTPAELAGATYKIAWYQAPADPKAAGWTERIVVASIETIVHALGVGDFNLDGDLDIAYAEMHQGADPDEVVVMHNLGGGTSWSKQVLSTKGSHDIVVADIDADGDLDIVGANHGGSYQPVELWRNTLDPTGGTPLDRWARRVVDSARPSTAVFVKAGDLDGDGKKDIASGGVWYRNPGTAGGTWTRSVIGAPLNNVAVLHDFDGDGDLDVLGTQGVGSASNHNFAWAQNNGSGSFTIRTNIATGGTGDFLQGAAVDRFTAGGPIEVALSWHNGGGGVQMLTVPANPATGTWIFRTLSSTTQSEDLSIGDIDRDGDKDLLLGTQWLRNDGASWSVHTLFSTSSSPDRNRLADVNKDGRLDAVIGYEAISTTGKVAWYAQPATATNAWTETVIANVIGPMSLDAADMDGDGDIDVVVGEHNLSAPTTAKLFVFENANGTGGSWTSHTVYTGDEHHDGAQAVDIDGDTDLDILSIGWGHNRVHLYENLAKSPGGGGGGQAPAPPSGLAATAVSSSQINLSWLDNSSDETGFKIERAGASGGPWTQIATVGAGATTFANTGLAASTAYWYRVRATNANGDSGYSNTATATTLAGGGGGGSVPGAGLQLWLKGDAGLTLNGSAVSQWADQSGAGRNALQATAASQPLRVLNAVNGKPAIQFDGTNDFMTFTLPVNGLSGMTIALVGACTADRTGGSTQAENAAVFWNETASWGTVYLSPFQTNVKFRFGTTQTNNKPAWTRPASIGSSYSTTISVKNGATDSLYVDGAQVLSQGGKLGTIAACRDTGNLGRGFNDTTYFPGLIAEVLVYNRALSDSERQGLQDYLAARYFTAGGNNPPTVSITSPANGASFAAGSNIAIQANAADSDGTISKVEFFQGATKLGEDTTGPYSITWNNVSAGSYTLSARATDNGGAATTSSAVNITVTAPTNAPPTVSLTSPTNGATFTAPATVSLAATAQDTDGTITKVEFFQGATKLGEDTTSPYTLTWTNVPAGSYSLTAKATDNGGAVAISSAVSITVNASGSSVPTSGLQLWLKADAGVTSSASAVSQWNDQSGNARNAVQATSASRPILVAGAVNGRPAVQFDGTNDFMTFTLPVNGLTGITIALVGACTADRTGGSTNAESAALFWNETASWGTVYLSPFQSNLKFRFGTGQTGNLPGYTRPGSIGSAYSTTISVKNGATDSLYVNGVQVVNQGGKLATIAACRDTGNLGRGFNDTTYFPGLIAEVLVYTRALSASERHQVEGYLNGRYFPSAQAAAAFAVAIDSVSSGSPYSLASAAPGALAYVDRSLTISALDPALEGGILVRTANDDKSVAAPDHLALSIIGTARLSVGIDPRAIRGPSWLEDGTWTIAPDLLVLADQASSPMRVYRKTVDPGTVTLGGNYAGGDTGARANYLVIVQPAFPSPGPTAPTFFAPGPLPPDVWEHPGDTDGDGLYDGFEPTYALDPLLPDSDLDGTWDENELVPDGRTMWETQQSQAPSAATGGGGGGDSSSCGATGLETLLFLLILGALGRRNART